MVHRKSHWVKMFSAPLVMLLIGATCWAGTPSTFSLYFANVTQSGQIDFANLSGPYNFNYTVKSGKWNGTGKGKIKNLSKKEQKYKNKITYGLFAQNNLTQQASLYKVPAGKTPQATFTASGTSP